MGGGCGGGVFEEFPCRSHRETGPSTASVCSSSKRLGGVPQGGGGGGWRHKIAHGAIVPDASRQEAEANFLNPQLRQNTRVTPNPPSPLFAQPGLYPGTDGCLECPSGFDANRGVLKRQVRGYGRGGGGGDSSLIYFRYWWSSFAPRNSPMP